MSENSPNSLYTEEEYADMIQCYLASREDLQLTQMCYKDRYPSRRQLSLDTLRRVTLTYLETLESVNTENEEEVTNSSNVDDRILQYFINNPHATVKKAASIFCVETCYIERLLEGRKATIKAEQNEDEEISREEQSLYDFLGEDKTELVATLNIKQETGDSLEETVIKDELEFEETNIEAIIRNNENNGVTCSETIKTETQDFALYSEPIKSDTDDNCICKENNMNETKDVANCSETTTSETDDDLISLMEYTKKRKKKYLKRSGTKKLRSSEKRKRKSSTQDSNYLESSQMYNAIVYTTRLEEMAILHKKIKHLDNSFVLKEILLESKPIYNSRKQKSNITIKRAISFKLLKIKLKKFMKKQTVIDLTDKLPTSDNDDDLIVTNVIYPKKITAIKAEDAEFEGISKKCNVIIVINNLFTNLREIYITDRKCNIIEYHCTKLNDNDKNALEFDQSKIRLILDSCCWFHRQNKVESIWPRDECTFFRFLTTIHRCSPNACTCCCKPKVQTTGITLYTPYDEDIFNDNFNTESDDNSKILILTASEYKKPDTNIYTCSNRKNSSHRSYLFTETLHENAFVISRKEYFEIGSNQEVLRLHKCKYWRSCNQCTNMTEYALSCDLDKVSVCCKWKRDSFLYAEYKACNISANTLRFLKKTLFPSICDSCKCILGPEINQSSNFVVDMSKIEHTRTSVKPTLLKIGYNSKPSAVAIKSVKNLAQKILRELKTKSTPEDISYLEELNITEPTINVPSTVKLKVIDLVAKVVNDSVVPVCDIETSSQSCLKTFENVNKETNVVNENNHEGKNNKYPPLSTCFTNEKPSNEGSLKVLEDFDVNNQNNANLFNNKNQMRGDDIIEILDDSPSDQETTKVSKKKVTKKTYKNKKQASSKTFTKKQSILYNELVKLKQTSSKNKIQVRGEVPIRSADDFRSDKELKYLNNLQPHDFFTNVISCSKNCYAESFKSYLKLETESNTALPKISSVFSLQNSAKQTQIQTNEPSPSTSKAANASNNLNADSSVPLTGCIDPIDIQNNFNSSPQFSTQIVLCDPITKMSQAVHLTPNLLNAFDIVAQPVPNINAKPIAILDNNTITAVLTPAVNQIRGGNMTFMPKALQPVQETSILPDIINDIPKDIDMRSRENYEIIIKEEADDDVVILDSD